MYWQKYVKFQYVHVPNILSQIYISFQTLEKKKNQFETFGIKAATWKITQIALTFWVLKFDDRFF